MIAAVIKGSATEVLNYFALEEQLYICVHKCQSPPAKKVNKQLIPSPDA